VKIPKNVSLWDHQLKAVRAVAPFLQGRPAKQVQGLPSALVNIPTGGGKTAVIGTLGHWHPAIGRLLVVAPRSAIRDQLARELSARRGFFLRSGYTPETLPKKIIALNSARNLPQKIPGDVILVSTIQLINDMAADRVNNGAYDRLAKSCDAVIVDEGHYEPAERWSQALRGLGRPIVLVTATPYRNDLKSFAFDPNAIHVSKYSELTDLKILRAVEVVQAAPEVLHSPKKFVDSVLAEFVGYYGTAPTANRKLIIRCRSLEQIREIGDLMRRHRHGRGGVLCLHERFAPNQNRPWEKRQPTDPEAPDAAAIWVHQHKLLEGVDGPSFRAVAFYGVVGSARALVQQVGRVIRNPTRSADERSLMIDHSQGVLADMWRRFLEYDASIDQMEMMRGLVEFTTEFDARLPPVIYADRQFRRRFDFAGSPEPIKQSLRLPLRCHLYSAKRGFKIADLRDITKMRLQKSEFPFESIVDDDGSLLILFAKIENSPLLAEHYFVERELHAFVVMRVGQNVAVLDTSRPGLDGEATTLVGRPLERDKITRLLRRSSDTKLIEINSRNAALGPSAVRRRAASAASLEETPPALDEFQYVASSITAVDPSAMLLLPGADPDEDSFSMRSVGFGLGPVTDASTRQPLEVWRAWAGRLIAASSDGSRSAPSYLDRFTKPLGGPPKHPWPRNVLLDVGEARTQFVTTGHVSEPLYIEDVCLDCTPVAGNLKAPRQISLVANGTPCVGTLGYDEGAERYQLVSGDLVVRYRYEDGTRIGNLVDFLNAGQRFVVVPDSDGAIYSEGEFFDPRLGLGPRFDPAALGLDDTIRVFPALRACLSEKGGPNTANGNGWAPGSVFEWIDTNWNQILPNAELVVCDDGQSESCDFILAGTRNGRGVVVMVHAKASRPRSRVSASSLHDVCAQAAKQVGTLAQFSARQPPQAARWHLAWSGSSGEGRVDSRIRRKRAGWVGLNGPQIWDRLEAMLKSQATDREVVLVLGASLDRMEFFRQARAAHPPAPAVHCVNLLRSTMAAVGGVNARLRVFCS
jgi:superfamily II DNA or RNA helicase